MVYDEQCSTPSTSSETLYLSTKFVQFSLNDEDINEFETQE